MDTRDAKASPLEDLDKTIVLIGLMGAGKSAIGKRLAKKLGVDFVDSDRVIEEEADCTINEIFARDGEDHFRKAERNTILRLLDGPVKVLATGGGAFMNDETRAGIMDKGIAVWLKADLEVLLSRVTRRNTRPLLKTGDPREIMTRLMNERHPVYAQAPVVVPSDNGPHGVVVQGVIDGVADYLLKAQGDA